MTGIPALWIERARETRIESIIEERGIALRGRVERIGPCPVCGGTDRFAVNTRKQLFNCRGCDVGGDAISLVQFLHGGDFPSAVERLSGARADGDRRFRARSKPLAKPDNRCYDVAKAIALWGQGVDPRGTLAERYLASRRLALENDVAGKVLRWHSGVGAMLGLFRNIATEQPQAVSRTFLDPEGHKLGRKFLGPVGGAAIMLDASDTVLGGLLEAWGSHSHCCHAAMRQGPISPL
jgi:hypothetical protein